MRTSDWSGLADVYDEKQGDEGDFWHRAYLDPALFETLGDVAKLRVLDLACGNGHNTRRLARLGAQVTGVDISEVLVERSRARDERDHLGIQYYTADAARLEVLADEAFDLVVCQMALMDIPDAAAAIREVARVLRPAGRFVALLSHPCFDIPEASGWVVERIGPTTTVWRKLRRYAEPFQGAIHWRVNGELVYTPSYHRPLSWYTRALGAAGFVLTAFEEPRPSHEFLEAREDGAWMVEIPLVCLLEARKITL